MARVDSLELIGSHLLDLSKFLKTLVVGEEEEDASKIEPEDSTVKFIEVIDSNPKKSKKYRVQLKDKTNLLTSIPE